MTRPGTVHHPASSTRVDGHHIAVAHPVTPASVKTVTGLFGAVTVASQLRDGVQGEMKAAFANGHRLHLSYDPATRTWATAGEAQTNILTNANTSGTSYTLERRGPFMPWKQWTDLGFLLQVQVLAPLTAGASSSVFAAACATYADLDGSDTTNTTDVSGAVTTNQASEHFKDSGWVTVNSNLTPVAYIALGLAHKRSGSNDGTLGGGSCVRQRWAYALA